MSNQVYEGGSKYFYLKENGVEKVSFLKLTTHPLAYLDRGILYELTDGKLYYNGNEVITSITGNYVQGPVLSTDNALPRFNGADGDLIQDSGVIVDDDDNVTGVGSLTMVQQEANPGTDATLWLDTDDSLRFNALTISGLMTPAYAFVAYENLNTGTPVALTSSNSSLNPTTTMLANDSIFTGGLAGVATYNGADAIANITANVSFSSAEVADQDIWIHIGVNGSSVLGSGARIAAAQDVIYNVALTGLSALVDTDTVSVFGQNLTSNSNITLRCLGINITTVLI